MRRKSPTVLCAAFLAAGIFPVLAARAEGPRDGAGTIAAGDSVEFRVVESGEESRRLPVSPSGDIEVPRLGRVAVAGKTGEAVAAEVKALLEKRAYFTATVLVSVVRGTASDRPTQAAEPKSPDGAPATARIEKPPAQVTVVGRVRLQGAQDLPQDGRYYLSHAIVRAGGLTTWANGRKVQVIRKNEEGKSEKFIADVISVLKDGQAEKDVELQPGDTVIVPEKLLNL